MSSAPWYRHGMVWLVLGLPATAIALGITLVVIASSGPNDLVRSDWYKHGRAVNEDLSRVHAAHALGLAGELALDGRLLTVALRGPVDPDALHARLLHPTLAAEDRHLVLARVGGGLWQTRLAAPLPAGPRTVQLTAPGADWRLEGQGHPGDAPIALVGLAP